MLTPASSAPIQQPTHRIPDSDCHLLQAYPPVTVPTPVPFPASPTHFPVRAMLPPFRQQAARRTLINIVASSSHRYGDDLRPPSAHAPVLPVAAPPRALQALHLAWIWDPCTRAHTARTHTHTHRLHCVFFGFMPFPTHAASTVLALHTSNHLLHTVPATSRV